jgi:hypothetical protein
MALPTQFNSDEETGISAMTVEIPLTASATFVWDVVRDIYSVHQRLIPGSRRSRRQYCGRQDRHLRRRNGGH